MRLKITAVTEVIRFVTRDGYTGLLGGLPSDRTLQAQLSDIGVRLQPNQFNQVPDTLGVLMGGVPIIN